MASGDTRTQQYLDIAANGTRADLPSDTCCETRTQTLIRGVAERIMDVEDEVERLENNPDVVDIVDTYADLQAYDTSGLTDKDIIRVIADETKDGLSSYYRWNSPNAGWNFVGVIPDDGIKELSADDYNYPTNDPDRVALWLLDNGLYTAPAGVLVAASTTSYPWYNTSDKTILVGGSDTVKGIYTFLNGKVDVVTTQVSDGTEAEEYTLLKSSQVVDNLSSVLTDNALSANQGRVLKNLIDSIAIRGAGAPTTSTVGEVGQLYEDGTNGALYQLKSIDITVTPNTYNWEQVGGSSVNVVQTTGTSTTDVMSQNAVTSMIYADPETTGRVRIGNRTGQGEISVDIGRSQNIGWSTGLGAISIGHYAAATAQNSIEIGTGRSSGAMAVTIGYHSGSGDGASGRGSIALGAEAKATQQGEMNIGTTATSFGFNSSNYRLLTGLYDPQSDHDAATKGYVDTAVAGAGANTISSTDWSALWQ